MQHSRQWPLHVLCWCISIYIVYTRNRIRKNLPLLYTKRLRITIYMQLILDESAELFIDWQNAFYWFRLGIAAPLHMHNVIASSRIQFINAAMSRQTLEATAYSHWRYCRDAHIVYNSISVHTKLVCDFVFNVHTNWIKFSILTWKWVSYWDTKM